jgi:YVTN family beta-propeller protein
MIQRVAVLIGLLGLSIGAATSHADAAAKARVPLARVKDVRLPGGPTRFDYQAIDPRTRSLYVAHLGDSSLDVIDLNALRVVATVPGLPSIHGVTVATDRQRVYATGTGHNELVAIDAATNQAVARVSTGDFPDGVAYDPDDQLVFVSNKNDGSLTVVDATRNAAIDTIKIGDETGNVAYDSTTRTVYVAARTPDTLVAIDPTTHRITSRVPLPGCDGAHGVQLDSAAQRAFIACERNARLITVDLHAARSTAAATIGVDPDVLALDPGLHRLYIAAESGTVSVFDVSRAVPRAIGQGHLADAAHTVAVDPDTHRVYFPLENLAGKPTLRVMKPLGT